MIHDMGIEDIDVTVLHSALKDKTELCESYKEVIDLLVRNLNSVIDDYNKLREVAIEAEQGYETAVTLTKKAVDLCRSAVLNPAVEQESRLTRLTDMLSYSEELKIAHASLQRELAYFSDKLPNI